MLNIILLGLISFFTDVSTEMVYPLIPLYLTAVFGATPALIGLIEGIAESLASLLKVFSGYITDRFQKKRRIALIGYSTSLLYKLALILATSWGGILFARIIDRIGKGIRTTPRDVMVSESADPSQLGRAFGIHKALDMAGSALGIILAYFLVRSVPSMGSLNDTIANHLNYKRFFLISIIPALVGILLFSFIREKKSVRLSNGREPFWKNIRQLNRPLKFYLLITLIFTLGNSSNAFLLLRAKHVGFSDSSVILLYFLYNISASLLAIPVGKQSDRIGRKRVLVAGYTVFALVYLGFAIVWNSGMMIALFALYGLYTAMITGVERAYIAEIAPPALKGTMLGLHATIVGLALLPASLIAGALWNLFGAAVPFALGAGLSLFAAIMLAFLMKDDRKVIPPETALK